MTQSSISPPGMPAFFLDQTTQGLLDLIETTAAGCTARFVAPLAAI
jgi:hypothetical protein